MESRRRRPPPPWERGYQEPRHPTGRARRRWPRAYDGGEPVAPRINARYRRAYDGGSLGVTGRGRGSVMQRI
ncbi:MAG TPA: hypothetical protein VHG28_08905, partial [Longimicrobiaceae bacterium]|nr:hypothetical protein [Longimicrobiaceae bacterium]